MSWLFKSPYEKAAEAKIKKSQQAAYYQAKEKEASEFARQKARIEREQAVARLRGSGKGSSGGFMGFMDNIARNVTSNKNNDFLGLGGGMGGFGGSPRVKSKARYSTSYKKIGKGKYKKVRRRVGSVSVPQRTQNQFDPLGF